MGKKRAREADGKQAVSKDADRMDEDSDDEENFDIVNVEFEWFNFDADIDFHGTKSLLRQLLDVDAPLFDVSALADLILAQPTIGSTVKVDGKANDAYALVTALSLRELSDKPAIATLMQYLAEKAAAQVSGPPALASVIPGLLEQQQQQKSVPGAPHVGLVLSERLVNMPAEVAPPMFGMLVDEIEAAVEDGEPYAFTHYLVLSKMYQEVQSSLAMVVDMDEEDGSQGGGKRKKARSSSSAAGTSPIFHFHPEDEVLQRHALAYGTYAFTKDDEVVADSKRAFQEMGVKAHGLMILIEASKFEGAVKAIGEYLQAS